MQEPIKAIIFDLDGTLLDTLEEITDSANEALAELGLPPHPAEAYKKMVGEGILFFARAALPPSHHDEATIMAWMMRVKEITQRGFPGKTKPYDGIPELLDALSRRGTKMAILSNRPEELLSALIRDLLGRWRFHPVVGAAANGPPKPDPAGARAIARELSVEPGECLFLGDSSVDMQAAAAAGMRAVGALWGFRSAEELVAHGAAALAERPAEVLEMVGAPLEAGSPAG